MDRVVRTFQCRATGKTVYPTEETAREQILLFRWRNESKRGYNPQNAYECEHCGFWHITSWAPRQFAAYERKRQDGQPPETAPEAAS